MDKSKQFKEMNLIKFYNRFSIDESCYQYLSHIKWMDDVHYICKSAGKSIIVEVANLFQDYAQGANIKKV